MCIRDRGVVSGGHGDPRQASRDCGSSHHPDNTGSASHRCKVKGDRIIGEQAESHEVRTSDQAHVSSSTSVTTHPPRDRRHQHDYTGSAAGL
eukprot:12536573-Alexandrium_andersonii.AAC.1